MLSVKNLHASVGDKQILRGINLEESKWIFQQYLNKRFF